MENISTKISGIFRSTSPFVFTILGASGDLAKIKIFPSIFSLAEQHRFKADFCIFGYARSEIYHEEFRNVFSESVKKAYKNTWGEYQEKILRNLLEKVFYIQGQYDSLEDFQRYAKFRDSNIKTYEQEVFYTSIPPFIVEPVLKNLNQLDKKEKQKIILEKPFGTDYKTAKELIHTIKNFYKADQIFLLDHYMGKKAVRSILPLRYNNHLLNLLFKSDQISEILVEASETVGVEKRLGYFNKMGTLKDMIQSHLLQILALTIMDIPVNKSPRNIHREKNNILEALEFFPEKKNVTFGQYEGYCDQDKTVCGSKTATFAEAKIMLDRESWSGVPITLRSGKCLHEKRTRIELTLKKSPHQSESAKANKIIIELFPEETIKIRLVNENGIDQMPQENDSSQSLSCHGDYCLTEHGLLFLDVLQDKQENFLSYEEILSCWRVTDKILEYTKGQEPTKYKKGSRGPQN